MLTIPQVFPPEGHNAHSNFYRPYQSIGARGVNNLANKLLLSVMPPNTPFFKLAADDKTIAELSDEKARAQVEEKFNEIERTVQTRIETSNYRAPFITGFKQLIVGGNVLLVFSDDNMVRVIRLDNYVVRRDSRGNVLEVIIEEATRYEDLPEDIQKMLSNGDLPSDRNSNDKDLFIYTVYEQSDKGGWKTYQTINNKKIEGSEGIYPKDKQPFIALRWSYEDNEDYGRGYVEEYIGDLQSAEGLSKSIIESAAAAAKVVTLVNPNGLTREEDVADAENLDIITGRVEDVTLLQLAKQADMQVAHSVLQDILQRLSYAFLMNTAVQRDAERVTAEEIREMVKELEDALGGTYALLAQEFQLPFVRILMHQLVKEDRIPNLDALKKDGINIEPNITTGLEAIGRGHDLSKLQMFFNTFVVPFGEVGMAEINYGDFLKRAGVSLGIDMDGLVKSAEQKQQEQQIQQQQQQQAMQQQMVADGVKAAAGPVAKAAVEQGI